MEHSSNPAPSHFAAQRDVTPEGFGPSENVEIVRPTLERIRDETTDEAMARMVGYQIENGRVKIEQMPYDWGWKATVAGNDDGRKTFSAFKKQDVINDVYQYLYPDYAVPA